MAKTAQQGNAYALDGHIRAGDHRYSHIGSGQGWSIVHAVTRHHHHPAFILIEYGVGQRVLATLSARMLLHSPMPAAQDSIFLLLRSS